MPAAMAGPSSGGGGGGVHRSFWKAGAAAPAREGAMGDFDRARPEFLHTNATSQKWAFGAIAELINNGVDEICNGATYIKVDKSTNLKDNTPMLIFEDNGGGMDPEGIRQCMSLGFSTKKSKTTNGQYLNGFKTSTMRLGADAIVFTRAIRGSNVTLSIGLLSYTFLRGTMKDDIIVPMLDFKIEDGTIVPLVYGSQGDWDSTLKIILDWSPFSSEEELLQQFQDIGTHGTKVAIYNLWMNDDDLLELDFDDNDEDILLRDQGSASGEFTKIQKEIVQQHISYRLRFSLRAYTSILYLKKFDNFQIILRGKPVEHVTITNDLKYNRVVTYTPRMENDSQVVTVNIEVGFAKEAPVWAIFGLNIYHKNRLIMPFWKVLQEESKARSVIGVLEANHVEPSHGKQDFERTDLFLRLERKLKETIASYWRDNCYLIGYQPVRSRYKKTLKDSDSHGTRLQQKASSAHRTGGLLPTLLPETYDDVSAVKSPNTDVSVVESRALSGGGKSAPAAWKKMHWTDDNTTLFCTLYTSLLITNEVPTKREKYKIIAQRMTEETGMHFTDDKVGAKHKMLNELYRFSKIPQRTKEKKCEKTKRGQFRKLKDGKIPPYFEALQAMIEAENSATSKGQQGQLHHLAVQEKEEFRRIMRENEVLQKHYSDLQKKFEDLQEKFNKEVQQCKHLHNELVDIKGSIRVYCRCRPPNAAEETEGALSIIESINDEEIVIRDNVSYKKAFKFDSVFGPEKDQEKVFDRTAPFATSLLDGFDVCVFAYGQTGTGKTFTMEGVEGARGINYRILDKMFNVIKTREGIFQYEVSVSVLEVYNEEIRDLLLTRSEPDAARLEVRQVVVDGKKAAHHVPGLVEARVSNIDEAWEVMQKGMKQRVVGSTNMNQHSSRSHCLHCVMVSGKDLLNEKCMKSKLWLVDLAGSERVDKTGAEGETLKESQNINKSLSALGDVVCALATNAQHVPYRNSKLTYLLQDSLSGEAKTLMLLHISPTERHLQETLSSLEFAARVRGIGFRKQVDFRRYKQMEAKCEKMAKSIEVLEAENKLQRDKIRELESQSMCSPFVVSKDKGNPSRLFDSSLKRPERLTIAASWRKKASTAAPRPYMPRWL